MHLRYEKKNNIDNIKGCNIFKKKCENSKKKLIKLRSIELKKKEEI